MACRLADSVLTLKGPHQTSVRSRRFAPQCSPGLYYPKWENHLQKDIKYKGHSFFRRKIHIVRAVAVPVAPISEESAENRRQLANSYGFRQIGEPLPENVTLKDVIDSLPRKGKMITKKFLV